MIQDGKKPYFAKKGRVDENYHIRSIDSSLRIMNDPNDGNGRKVNNGFYPVDLKTD